MLGTRDILEKLNPKYATEFLEFCDAKFDRFRCYRLWHDKVYLKICMANLYEKYLGVGKTALTALEWETLCEGYKQITKEEYEI